MAFVGGDTSCPCCFRPGLDRPTFCMPVGGPRTSGSKIDIIRQLLKVHSIDAYVQPMGDAHASEYISDADKRVEWLTSFTGSAGTAVVTADKALLWTDGRYFAQAAKQLKGTGFELMKMNEPGVPDLEEWAKDANFVVGVDPTLVSLSAAEEWSRKGCDDFKLVEHNLVDRAWGETKPKRSANALRTHGKAVSGESAASKLMRVAGALKEKGCTSLVLNALDQICWLFNLRGADIACNPVFFAYAVVKVNDAAAVVVTLFLRALDDDVKDAATKEAVEAHLAAEGCNGGNDAAVTLAPYSSFNAATAARLAGCDDKEAQVMLERATTTLAMAAAIVPEQRVLVDASPVELFKAKKNEVDCSGPCDHGLAIYFLYTPYIRLAITALRYTRTALTRSVRCVLDTYHTHSILTTRTLLPMCAILPMCHTSYMCHTYCTCQLTLLRDTLSTLTTLTTRDTRDALTTLIILLTTHHTHHTHHACSPQVERSGLERAGRKDAAAVVSYFAWLERSLLTGGVVTEAEGADEISARRSGMDGWVPHRHAAPTHTSRADATLLPPIHPGLTPRYIPG